MEFVDLPIEVQNAILEYCRRNFIEPLEETLNSLAEVFDSAVEEVLVVGEITGVIGGYSTSQLLSSTRSEILNNMVTQALDMAEKYEQNLMIINYNSIASPLCAKWQDKIYYIYEPVDDYKKLDDNIWHGKKNTSGGSLFIQTVDIKCMHIFQEKAIHLLIKMNQLKKITNFNRSLIILNVTKRNIMHAKKRHV